MATGRPPVMLDILEEHFEMLAFLWGQRQSRLRSPAYTVAALGDLEERIEAHVQGLLVGEEEVIPLVEQGLSGDDPLVVFAAAYPLLRSGREEATRRVLDAFARAHSGPIEGFCQALCHGPITPIIPHLLQEVTSAPPPIGAAAAEALAFHGASALGAVPLDRFLEHAEPGVRQGGWRAVSWLGISQDAATYRVALSDEDPGVRREAMLAAAWTRQPWLLEHCRALGCRPSPDSWDALRLLAILGQPQDLPTVLAIGQADWLGPRRLPVLGAYGHPAVVEALLTQVDSPEPRTATAAGAAFTKLTGCDIDSDRRVQLPPEDGSEPDEFQKEFLDEVRLPDPERARAHWQNVKGSTYRGTRWCRGFDLSRGAPGDILAQLDLESRWETCLRGKWEGTWPGSPVELEVFPQKSR
jgi:uncharacterized protein (TIGR02270 family)